MKLCGIEIDDPRERGIARRDYREYKEGVRTTVREMWVYSYVREGSAVSLWQYPLTITNRGVCTFDGKQVKDEGERKLIGELFASVRLV